MPAKSALVIPPDAVRLAPKDKLKSPLLFYYSADRDQVDVFASAGAAVGKNRKREDDGVERLEHVRILRPDAFLTIAETFIQREFMPDPYRTQGLKVDAYAVLNAGSSHWLAYGVEGANPEAEDRIHWTSLALDRTYENKTKVFFGNRTFSSRTLPFVREGQSEFAMEACELEVILNLLKKERAKALERGGR